MRSQRPGAGHASKRFTGLLSGLSWATAWWTQAPLGDAMREFERIERLYDDGFAFYDFVWLLGPETVARARKLVWGQVKELLDAGHRVATVPSWSIVYGK